jgi:hypothetical protein
MIRNNIRMSNVVVMLVFLLLTVLHQPIIASTMCCERSLAVTPIEMPEGETVAEGWCTWGTIFVGVLQGCICDAIADEPECPIDPGCYNLGAMIDFNKWLDTYTQAAYGLKPDVEELESRKNNRELDYLFISNVTCSDPTVLYQTEEDPTGGDTLVETTVLFGHWAMNVQVVDHFHGNVLDEFDISWIGRAGDFIQPEHYRDGKSYTNSIREAFLEYFVPLDKMFYDYERTPDTCSIKPQKDSVELGEKIEIRAEAFVDSLQRQSAKFQRIMVTAQKGEILNGVKGYDNKHVFVVGESGVVKIEYRAPENCDAETDTIIIENSCYFNDPLDDVLPGVEICRQALKIYDHLPKRCNIKPETPSVEAGTAINVDVTNIVDNMNKPMQPEERVMVKAGSGKITNGMSHGAYKIFEVGNGTINARYRAKNDCDILADTIEVYSCCIEGEDIPQFVPQELIRKKRVDIKCEYEWTGSLTFSLKSDFSCDIDSTNPPRRTYLTATESGMQLGAIDILTQKIDIERRGSAMLTPGKMKASGYVNCSKDISRENGGRSDNGDWNTTKRTMTAFKHCQLTEDILSIGIGKDVTGIEAAIEQISKEILEASRSGDIKRIEELKIKMEDAVHGGKKESNQLSIHINIAIDCIASAQKTYKSQDYDAGKGEMVSNINNNSTEDVRIGTPIVLNMEGTYTKSKDGEHKITGSYSKSGGIKTGTGIGPIKCPPMSSSVNCNLTLTRRRK